MDMDIQQIETSKESQQCESILTKTPRHTPRQTKRAHKETVSPNSAQDDHAGAPKPTRRRNSIGSVTEVAQKANSSDASLIIGHKGKTFDLSQLVQTTMSSSSFIEGVAPALVKGIEPMLAPLISTTLQNAVDKAMKNALDKIEGQYRAIENLTSELKQKITIIDELQNENKSLKAKVHEMEKNNKQLTESLDDLEQYGRRNSLRFHNVQVSSLQTGQTDETLVKIINEKLSLNPPVESSDIERSHLIGKPNAGKAQLICKFKSWKTKAAVYKAKSKLKHDRSTGPKLFISEDLTKPRQAVVKQLADARRTGTVNAYWTNDGRIFYKRSAEIKPGTCKVCVQ